MKNKNHISVFVIILAGFILSLLHCPVFDIFFDDKEIFKYTGMAIAKGDVPYLSFFDHKPPLIFFINLIPYKFGPWVFWLIDTTLVCYVALLFNRLCREAGLKYSMLLPLVFILLIRNPFYSYGVGMTREYSTLFLLLFLCFNFSKGNRSYLKLGILAGLIFFMQQDQIVLIFPFVAYSFVELFKVDKQKALRYIFMLFAGSLFVAVPILIYLGANHALKAFWEDAFLFNFNWYSEKIPLSQHLKIIYGLLSDSKTEFIFFSTLLLLTCAFFFKQADKKLTAAAVLALFLSFISEYLSGKISIGLSLEYYALPIAATVPFCLYILFTKTGFADKLQEIHFFFYVAIMALPLVLHTLHYAGYVSRLQPRAELSTPEVKYLEKVPLKEHELFVAFNANYDFLYNTHKILSPSPWLYLSFWQWYGNWDPKNEKLTDVVNDLEKYHTKYLLNFSDSSKIRNKVNLDFWNGYVQKNYIPVLMPDSSYSKNLFSRK